MSSSHHKDRSGKGRGKGFGGRRGGRHTDPNVELSKTLSYILRHGAKNEGLAIRSDGYVKLDDLLRRPKLKGVDLQAVKHVVETSEKQRFTLLFVAEGEGEEGPEGVPVEIPAQSEPRQIPTPVGLDVAEGSGSGDKGKSRELVGDIISGPGVWWIRANQGHTIKVEDLELTPINDPAEVPVAIHGTHIAAWNKIAQKGLSVMGRNHIHIAVGRPGVSGVLSGMRASSEILIHIDMEKAMGGGIKFYRSANNVILTPGDEEGFLLKEYFSVIERRDGTLLDDSWRTA